ncbi:MAG TPA: hypothetical protein VGS28_00290 [Candidatus Saccharimonadales bacterium]|nr:hypothetical protein [Candidatus Saccharimonadales bacterium]
MARLPTPGGDSGTWGTVLNDFLEVSLNSDGTIQTGAISSAGGELTSNKGKPSGYAGLSGSGFVPSGQLGTGVASSSNFLRGDGTWATPNSGSSTLAADTDVSINSPTNGQALIYNSGSSKWTNQNVNQHAIAVKNSSYILTTNDEVILADATTGPLTITLPTATGNTNLYDIKKVDSSSNTVTISASGGQTIDGGGTAVIKVQYASVTLVAAGSNWYVI